MIPKHVIGELVVAEADEEGGLFEGRSERGHKLRRFGGYSLLEISAAEAEQLRSPHLGEGEKRAILNRHFEPVNPEAVPGENSFGLQRVLGGACLNILEVLPANLTDLKINSHKAVHLLIEYPRPHSNDLQPGIPKPPPLES
jgi:hypothetical protein